MLPETLSCYCQSWEIRHERLLVARLCDDNGGANPIRRSVMLDGSSPNFPRHEPGEWLILWTGMSEEK